MEPAAATAASRAWYGESIADFLNCSPDSIIGTLTRNGDFAVVPEQRDAWLTQTDFLRAQLKDLSGTILLEFNIPAWAAESIPCY